MKEWREDLKNSPIGVFEFSRQTPPLRDLDISVLTPKNSRRQEAVSIYADIDGFTAYVAKHIDSNPEDVVRTLHVIRADSNVCSPVTLEGDVSDSLATASMDCLLRRNGTETDGSRPSAIRCSAPEACAAASTKP